MLPVREDLRLKMKNMQTQKNRKKFFPPRVDEASSAQIPFGPGLNFPGFPGGPGGPGGPSHYS